MAVATLVSQNTANIITVAGTLLSLAGVIIAIWQIRKARSAAEVAAHAARYTRQALSRNVLLSDLTACTTGIEEIKVLVRGKRHEAALLRVTDLSRQLVQLQELPSRDDAHRPPDFKTLLTQLAVLRDLLERSTAGDDRGFKPVQINRTLSQVADAINGVIGGLKFQIPGEPSND